MPCFSYYLLCVSSTKSENKRVEQVLPRSQRGAVRRVVGPNNVYNNVSKCKNNKIK
jgi:hypothetical protein